MSSEPLSIGAPGKSPRGGGPAGPERLLEIVREVVLELHPAEAGRRTVALDHSLERDLGLDSLGRMELLGRLERSFGVSLPAAAVAAAETPRDLLRAVASAGEAGGGAVGPVADTGAADDAAVAATPEGCRSLVEVLAWHVERHPERRHVTFHPEAGEPQALTYGELQRRARRVAAGLQGLGLQPGASVALMLPTGLDYFVAFCGVLLAGGVPVPLYPPVRKSQIEDHLRRQAAILRTALAAVLITFDEILPLARLLGGQVGSLRQVTRVADLERAAAAGGLPAVRGGDVAFLQFTSGSTGDPKGVILTHDNLLANLRAIGRHIGLGPHHRVASWLPLYHDMGLIGSWMGSLYFAMPLSLLSPIDFLARPARWLWQIHHHRATHSAAPNFAYELCLARVADEEIEGLDLGSWEVALNGAEPVRPETLRRFADRFAPYGLRRSSLMPVYGLAECSLALAFPPPGREPAIDVVEREDLARSGRAVPAAADDPGALRFASCGSALPGHEIRVADAAGRELAERREGRLQFRGPSATSGYFRNPEATRRLFAGEWVDTGDLGYISGGEVFVTGRAKDLIIRAGRNIYPQEVEEAVGAIDGLRKGCVAVFGVSDPAAGTERLVILAETREQATERREELRAKIREAALDLLGTPPDEVVLAPPHAVLKTSSGKIRRAASRELYLRGEIGRRPAALWWQLVRLGAMGLAPRLRGLGRSAAELLYGGWFWLLAAALSIAAALGLAVLPGLERRRRLARGLARLLLRLAGLPLRVEGGEHLEGLGPCVVAANHASYIDAVVLTAALPGGGTFLAKRELEERLPARWLLGRLGTLFVERFDAGRGVEDTRRSLEAVRREATLVVFPEGTFERAPGLRPFRMGAFVVAAAAGVPVLPAALRGTRSMLRADSWLPRRVPLTVTFAPPIHPEDPGWPGALDLRARTRATLLRHCAEPDLQAEPASRRPGEPEWG